MSALLSIDKVTRSFGGLMAIASVSFAVNEGEIFGLIGPNGAGKTTCFNLITGLTPPDEGVISFAGKPITGLAPHRIAALGLARTFQNIRLFAGMSVLDNVRVPFQAHARSGLWGGVFGSRTSRAEEKRSEDEAMSLLELVGLADRAGVPAGSLPYGDRRRLEIARALMLKPRLLLLDEPAAGMNLAEKAGLADFIRSLRERFALTVLLIEHHVPLVMGLCDRLAVLDFGNRIALGTPDEVRRDPAVIQAYLGEGGA